MAPANVYILKPLNQATWDWVNKQVDWQMAWAGGIAVEHRYIDDLVFGMESEGFEQDVDFEVFS